MTTNPNDYADATQGKVNSVGLTFNTESIYSSACANVEHRPVVIETPPNILGVIDDAWMRYVTDLGNVRPDRGQGRSFLLVHDDFDGELPGGHFVFRTSTYRNWVMCRAFAADTGEGETALRWYREHHRIYPLATGPDPDATYVPCPSVSRRRRARGRASRSDAPRLLPSQGEQPGRRNWCRREPATERQKAAGVDTVVAAAQSSADSPRSSASSRSTSSDFLPATGSSRSCNSSRSSSRDISS
jgi:hypothetical protein